jgi:two-component system, sensor histidine kinase and response regulator
MQPDDQTSGVIDEAAALERIGGDQQLLEEIAGLFLQEYPELLDSMRQALAAGDATRLERAAHSLKGSASNFGAYACVEAALELERRARSLDLDRAPETLATLELRLAALHDALVRLAG